MREEVEWTFHKEFSHETGITVRINILPLRKPIYSFEIGVLKDGGYLNRYFPSGLEWNTDFAGIVGDLISQAHLYIDERSILEAEESARLESEKAKEEKEKRGRSIKARTSVKSSRKG